MGSDFTRRRTNGANDRGVIFNGKRIPGSRMYWEINQWSSGDEPELRFDCIEAVKEWTKEQSIIVGRQYHMYHADILRLLGEKEMCQIVVNGEDWMRPHSFDARRQSTLKAYKNFSDIPEGFVLLLKILNTDSEGVDQAGRLVDLFTGTIARSPVWVHYYHPEGYRYPCIMHHKFMIGFRFASDKWGSIGDMMQSCAETLGKGILPASKVGQWLKEQCSIERSAIYGSFNLSSAAPANLESVLIFRKTNHIIDDLMHHFLLVRSKAFPFDLFFNGKEKEWEEQKQAVGLTFSTGISQVNRQGEAGTTGEDAS